MVSISTGVKGLAAGACAIIALAAFPAVTSHAPVAAAQAAPLGNSGSLCTAGETSIFSCPLGAKHVSVCGSGKQAVYRYGMPGKVELTSRNLTLAKQAYSGGGETQIQVRNNDYTYILFDKTSRTGFGSGGQNDPDSRSGLLVRHAGKTLSMKECGDDAPIPSRASAFISAGGSIVAH